MPDKKSLPQNAEKSKNNLCTSSKMPDKKSLPQNAEKSKINLCSSSKMSDKNSLPQNAEKTKIHESQKNKAFNDQIEVLLKQGYSKERAEAVLKEKFLCIQKPVESDQSISDSDSLTDSSTKTDDDYKNLATESVALTQEDYAFAKRFNYLHLTSDDNDDSNKEVKPKKVLKPRKRNLQKQANKSQEENINSTVDTSAKSAATIQTVKKKVQGHKVGISLNNYPEDLLNNEQLILVQEEILENVKKQADDIIKPRFLNSTFKFGWLLVTCADSDTVEWLKGLCLKPWADAKLIIREQKNMCHVQRVFEGKFPNCSESNEEILNFLKAQNAGLNTADWKVYERKEHPKNKVTRITFVVDNNSVQQIKKEENKLSYKFGVVTFRLKNLPKFTKLEKQHLS